MKPSSKSNIEKAKETLFKRSTVANLKQPKRDEFRKRLKELRRASFDQHRSLDDESYKNFLEDLHRQMLREFQDVTLEELIETLNQDDHDDESHDKKEEAYVNATVEHFYSCKVCGNILEDYSQYICEKCGTEEF